MNSKLIIRDALNQYKENELIFASKLYKYKIYVNMNEATYYKSLERMSHTGELAKAAKGIYYKPQYSKYGMIPLSEKQIIKGFTENNTGMVIGYKMYNQFHLTTQVSKKVQVLSSVPDGFTKTVKNVNIKQGLLEYTDEVKYIIYGLEVLQNYNKIQDLNYKAFIDFSKEVAQHYKNETFEAVISKISYKKSTISFLREILNYYHISNNLEQYLSSLSSYKHPKMEDIYEIARISR